MRLLYGSTIALAIAMLIPAMGAAQGMDASRAIKGGGISVSGWHGHVDARAKQHGMTYKDDKLTGTPEKLHVRTGPAVVYWNPSNKASGDYTVKAKFTEPKFMNLNSHPHPYGIFIAGKNMGTSNETLLYCEAYGDGRFIVRGFGPEAFEMNGRRGESNSAVHKAAGVDKPVSQEIAMSVKGNTVSCSINGTVVASYPKSEVVTSGKLQSLDGVYGIRFAHNTEGYVTGLKKTNE
ncbi:MAG TPA: hypothetical protein VF283_11295 [Bryobacteraceae bacterium]